MRAAFEAEPGSFWLTYNIAAPTARPSMEVRAAKRLVEPTRAETAPPVYTEGSDTGGAVMLDRI
jgi:hypothetical protein